MKTPKDWIRFETWDGGWAMVEVGHVFAVQHDLSAGYFIHTVTRETFHVSPETAEEVVELVAKYRESR